MGGFLELAKTARRLAVELAKIFAQTGFIVATVKMVQGSSKFLCKSHLAGYDNLRRNLNKCWAQLEAKVTPTSDDLLTSNLFYSRITIVRNKKFEFEGILIIISILF